MLAGRLDGRVTGEFLLVFIMSWYDLNVYVLCSCFEVLPIVSRTEYCIIGKVLLANDRVEIRLRLIDRRRVSNHRLFVVQRSRIKKYLQQ